MAFLRDEPDPPDGLQPDVASLASTSNQMHGQSWGCVHPLFTMPTTSSNGKIAIVTGAALRIEGEIAGRI